MMEMTGTIKNRENHDFEYLFLLFLILFYFGSGGTSFISD